MKHILYAFGCMLSISFDALIGSYILLSIEINTFPALFGYLGVIACVVAKAVSHVDQWSRISREDKD